MSDEIVEMQAELQEVKKALRNGTAHLGMTGEPLQRYFLQLNEKENTVLSIQLQAMQVASSNGSGAGASAGHRPQPGSAEGSLLRGGSCQDNLAQGGATGRDAAAEGAAAPVAVAPAASPPEGPTQTFNRDDLESALGHLTAYESSVLETAKALRALSSLAYANASGVGGNERVLTQVLRACDLHQNEEVVWLSAMRAMCNMAYDPEVALGRLSGIPVLVKLVAALAKGNTMKDTGAKASEAIARLVAAEAGPPEGEEGHGVRAHREPKDGLGPLSSLFVAAVVGDASWQGVVANLFRQLVANEVVDNGFVAQRFVFAAPACSANNSMGSTRWLQMAKQLATESVDMGQALVEADAIKAAVDLMASRVPDGSAQLAGIEAMSGLVGNRWAGLQAFADVRGIQRIEAAMQQHSEDGVLQTKAMRALASGVQWPEDVQKKASYDPSVSVELTKTAMAAHVANVDLQVAALEGLSKYLDKLRCVDKVKDAGGEDLVKAVMVKHAFGQDQASVQVQTWGRQVLDHLGTDGGFNPRATTHIFFLPEHLGDKRLIVATEDAGKFLVDGSQIGAGPPVAWRRSKDDGDRHPHLGVPCGTTVEGVLCDGWLEVRVEAEAEKATAS